MAGSDDQILKVLIQFGLDDAQAKAAIGRINELKTSTNAAGDEAADFGGAIEKTSGEIDDAGVSADTFNIHGREMHRIFGELNRIAPGVGEGLRAAFMGPLGAVSALLFGIVLIEQHLKKAAEATDVFNEKQGQLDTKIWEDQQKAIASVAVEADKYATSLAKAQGILDALKQSESDEVEILKAQAKARQDILKAQEQAEIAAAGGDKTKEAGIRARYSDISTQDQLDQEARELGVRMDFLEAQKLEQKKATDAYAAAHRATTAELGKTPEATKDTAESDLLKLFGAKNVGEVREQFKTAQASAAAYGNAPLEAGGQVTPAGQAYFQAKVLGDALKAYDDANQAVTDHTERLRELNEKENQAKATLDGLNSSIANAQAAVDTAQSVLEINRNAAATANDTQTTGTIRSGLEASPGSEAANALNALFNQNQTTWNNFLAILKYHQDNHTTIAAEVEALKTYAENLQAQINQTTPSRQ